MFGGGGGASLEAFPIPLGSTTPLNSFLVNDVVQHERNIGKKIGNVEKQTHERVKSNYDIVSWHR
jgi:hypothetical protein